MYDYHNLYHELATGSVASYLHVMYVPVYSNRTQQQICVIYDIRNSLATDILAMIMKTWNLNRSFYVNLFSMYLPSSICEPFPRPVTWRKHV